MTAADNDLSIRVGIYQCTLIGTLAWLDALYREFFCDLLASS